MHKVKAFLKSLFWSKGELVLHIEALQAQIGRMRGEELTPEEREAREKQRVSVEEHERLFFEEIDAVRRMLGRNKPVFIAKLLDTINCMPTLLEEAIVAKRLSSSRHQDEFAKHLRAYFVRLCSGLTDLCVRFEEKHPDAYINARAEAGEFLNGYGCYPGMAGTTYRIDALFDGRYNAGTLGHPHGEKDTLTTFRTAVRFFQRALESGLAAPVPAGTSD